MLVSLKSVLTKAKDKKYAVGAFNTSDLEVTQGIINAAMKLKSPVIISTSEKAVDYAGIDILSQIVIKLAKKADIPVVLHLDHARGFSLIKKAIACGYSSVMIDASHLPFKKNIALTKKVVAAAHRHKVSVEGELGTIGGEEDYVKARKIILADPEQALTFIKQTGIDAFAAAVGTAHGLSKGRKEKLDFKRISKIAKITKLPLVLHGASEGVSPEDIKKAIKLGVCKVNIDTDLRKAFSKNIRNMLKRDKKVYDPRKILGSARDAVAKEVSEHIKLFGSKNKA